MIFGDERLADKFTNENSVFIVYRGHGVYFEFESGNDGVNYIANSCSIGDSFYMRRIIKTPVQHSDDIAVDLFAEKMKEKLGKSRDKGRSGWEDCPIEHLIASLKDHISKGDPVDVANFAMMISQRGESIKTPVWTKADQEKGILPTVGCLCIEGMYPEEVIAVTSKYIVTKTKTDGVCTTSIETFKRTYRPIETPREKYDRERDECIDKLLAKIPPSPITVVPAMKIVYEELRPFTGDDHD